MTSKVKTRFYSDLQIEKPFFDDFVTLHDGFRRKDKLVNGSPAYQVTCPSCKHHIALMGVANNKKTYILMCPNDECSCRKGLNLHQIISTYGTRSDKQRWWRARNSPTEVWYPIKNNKRLQPRNQYSIKKTFRETMEIKLESQFILMNNQINIEKSYQASK